ncbi:hypothetical protein GIS00_05925 [Nakamurella sp. YIM 132087]|uniref:Uncharacterized protein n=1 Tax=Nakamurella alba TaxID=2665158 RepID=A0A7K1FH87_9ACTN|nr:hypothetical protein [Nakamurella alba]MTD13482.1 hypothetical protein [Nakamurella alba]
MTGPGVPPAAPRRRRAASRPAGPPAADVAPSDVPGTGPGGHTGSTEQTGSTGMSAAVPPEPADRSRSADGSGPADSRRRRRRSRDRTPDAVAGTPAADPATPTVVAAGRERSQNKPGQDKPGQDKPGQDRPGADRRQTDRQTTDRPSGDRRSGDRRRRTDPDRALAELVSTRSTQVPVDLALRAREYALPTAEDMAEAEEQVQLVRRHYVPPTPFAGARGQSKQGRRPDRRNGPDKKD